MEKIENFANRIIYGDCVEVMKTIPSESVDLVITDPPYLVNYQSKDGRTIKGDNSQQAEWLWPAFAEIYRVLKPNSFCVSFYGFTQAEKFFKTWKFCGFRVLENFVFIKSYASSSWFAARYHEAAYLLAKGRPYKPPLILPSTLDWRYTGNRLHPTQKPIEAIWPIIETFSRPDEIVLDPFAGSGTIAVCAQKLNRRYIGIELDWRYFWIAKQRLRENNNY